MAISLRKSKVLASRFLLFTGYLFLLVIQFNYRYYTVANFFVYGDHAAGSVQRLPESGTQPARPTAYYHSAHRPSFLSLDKRFQFRHFIQPAFTCSPAAPVYITLEKRHDTPSPVYHSSDLPVNSLRGPPAA